MNQPLLEEVISHPDSSLLRFTVDQSFQFMPAPGVPEYWILNLADRQLEVYSKPDRLNGCFQAQVIVQPGNQVTITGPNGKSIELSVTDLL